jgi:hypothetical protein
VGEIDCAGGHFSRLEISSDDIYALMMTTRRCPVVFLQLNYLDRVGRRRILVNTEDHTYEADLVASRLMIDGITEVFVVERDHTYLELHRALLKGRLEDVCTFTEGLDVVRMIAVAEQAVVEQKWMSRCAVIIQSVQIWNISYCVTCLQPFLNSRCNHANSN